MSSIGWIDFSSEHRDKVRTVLDFLKVGGVVDELGIGIVRDAFADRLFPGLSTIQTRAKYFTLTAYLIRKFIDRGGRKERLESYLAYHEKTYRIRMVENDPERKERGIIGGSFGTSWKEDVIRRPSSIYWSGMRAYGFISPDLSLSEFDSALADQTKNGSGRAIAWSADDDDGEDDHGSPARVHIAPADDSYWENLSIRLTKEEAELLDGQIRLCQSDSLLARILSDESAIDQVVGSESELESGSFTEFTELPFLHSPSFASVVGIVEHAKDFWNIMEGAHIRYNVMLQEGAPDTDKRVSFEKRWTEWLEGIQSFPERWDSDFMWALVPSQGGRSYRAARRFIDDWIAEVQKGCPDLDRCDGLVRRREIQNKGSRARLSPSNHAGYPRDWVGLDGLDFRLRIARRVLADIREGKMGGSRA